MKLKLSHKDYLLALGILVAVIVMLTTLVYTDTLNPEAKNAQTPAQRKTGLNISASVIFKKVIGEINFNSLLRKNH